VSVRSDAGAGTLQGTTIRRHVSPLYLRLHVKPVDQPPWNSWSKTSIASRCPIEARGVRSSSFLEPSGAAATQDLRIQKNPLVSGRKRHLRRTVRSLVPIWGQEKPNRLRNAQTKASLTSDLLPAACLRYDSPRLPQMGALWHQPPHTE
jgi:hypothetical protein